jgi:hypothetical protein
MIDEGHAGISTRSSACTNHNLNRISRETRAVGQPQSALFEVLLPTDIVVPSQHPTVSSQTCTQVQTIAVMGH